MYTDWQSKFGLQLGKNVVKLTGETSADLKLLAKVCVKGMVMIFRLGGEGLEDFGCVKIKFTWTPLKALLYSYDPPSLAVNWRSIFYRLPPPLLLCWRLLIPFRSPQLSDFPLSPFPPPPQKIFSLRSSVAMTPPVCMRVSKFRMN